jgi:hypothetical protein
MLGGRTRTRDLESKWVVGWLVESVGWYVGSVGCVGSVGWVVESVGWVVGCDVDSAELCQCAQKYIS